MNTTSKVHFNNSNSNSNNNDTYEIINSLVCSFQSPMNSLTSQQSVESKNSMKSNNSYHTNSFKVISFTNLKPTNYQSNDDLERESINEAFNLAIHKVYGTNVSFNVINNKISDYNSNQIIAYGNHIVTIENLFKCFAELQVNFILNIRILNFVICFSMIFRL